MRVTREDLRWEKKGKKLILFSESSVGFDKIGRIPGEVTLLLPYIAASHTGRLVQVIQIYSSKKLYKRKLNYTLVPGF